jgi:hypothetical protein
MTWCRAISVSVVTVLGCYSYQKLFMPFCATFPTCKPVNVGLNILWFSDLQARHNTITVWLYFLSETVIPHWCGTTYFYIFCICIVSSVFNNVKDNANVNHVTFLRYYAQDWYFLTFASKCLTAFLHLSRKTSRWYALCIQKSLHHSCSVSWSFPLTLLQEQNIFLLF